MLFRLNGKTIKVQAPKSVNIVNPVGVEIKFLRGPQDHPRTWKIENVGFGKPVMEKISKKISPIPHPQFKPKIPVMFVL